MSKVDYKNKVLPHPIQSKCTPNTKTYTHMVASSNHICENDRILLNL